MVIAWVFLILLMVPKMTCYCNLFREPEFVIIFQLSVLPSLNKVKEEEEEVKFKYCSLLQRPILTG